jgi:hypothetical protein
MLGYQAVCELGGRLFAPTSLKTFFDEWIPTNVYIMWPYIACLVYVPLSGFLYAFNRKLSARHVVAFYVSVLSLYVATYALYIVFPTTARDVMITSYDPTSPIFINEGMFQALQGLYTSITPLGDFPSLHVAPLVFMGLFLFRYWRVLFWIFLPFAFFGAIGTVVLKFHTFVGFAGGIGMGYFCYFILYHKIVFPALERFFEVEK